MFSLRLFIVISLSLGTLAPSWAAKKTDATKENLKQVHEKIETLKKELDASQDAHKDAADALKASETAISQAQKKLHEINQAQQQKRQALETLNQKSMHVNAQLAEQQKRLAQQLNQQYRQWHPSYTQLLLEQQDPNTIARELKYYSYIAKARGQLITAMQSNLNQIQTLNEETTATLAQVAALKAKQEQEQLTLEQQKLEKARIVNSLSQQITSQRNQINKLKRNEKDLLQLVERIAKQEVARQEAARQEAKKHEAANKKPPATSDIRAKKAQPSTPALDQNTVLSSPTVIAKNENLPSHDASGHKFTGLKGKLRLPVRGEVTNRFGSARADTGIQWKGLFIKAGEGNEVKSVADGRVVFADWMRGFGNLIIIDHGNGYLSLYGNNQALIKSEGDQVSSGDTIAAVGNSGGNASHGLYYELRKNSVPFDPLSWSQVR